MARRDELMTYAEQLKDPRWLAVRDRIIMRDMNMCRDCHSGDNLHVHHKRYLKGLYAWEYSERDLITLCVKCHRFVHGLNEDGKDMNDPFVRLPEFRGDLVRLVARMNKR